MAKLLLTSDGSAIGRKPMSMDFIFTKPNDVDYGSLRQGDLLIKNPHLKAAIAEAHKYYADTPDYTHFLVLTQSCDLVRRGKKPPKSRYITLAAAQVRMSGTTVEWPHRSR